MSTMTAPVPATTKKIAPTLATKERPSASTVAANGEVTSDRIRARAFEIYQARNGNGGQGDAASDWSQAERELNGAAPDPSVSTDIEAKAQTRGERLVGQR